MARKEFDLDNRLFQLAFRIIDVVEQLPDTSTCKIPGNHLLRSGTSVALNYCEVQSAESGRDFIHKFNLVLKELRESFVNLRILNARSLLKDAEFDGETDELIAIVVTSINTAKRNGEEVNRTFVFRLQDSQISAIQT